MINKNNLIAKKWNGQAKQQLQGLMWDAKVYVTVTVKVNKYKVDQK